MGVRKKQMAERIKAEKQQNALGGGFGKGCKSGESAC